jgi:seryl-tRNA synthetase
VGAGARLARALIGFMLDLHVREHGYTEVTPPLLVRRDSMQSTGQLPKFEAEAYRTDPDDLFLVPTAEVPVTNLHRNEILDGATLPICYAAYTPCFRREAGAAGKDTRGLLRVHQFDKVELVRFCRAADSPAEHETLTRHAERVLQLLELPYRVVLLAAGDVGFASAKTYDLEVWAPGVGQWLEVSSASTFTDFQARRASIRCRPRAGDKPEFVHTLNASGVALARTIAALLEVHQLQDGSVAIPRALVPAFGAERLVPAGGA